MAEAGLRDAQVWLTRRILAPAAGDGRAAAMIRDDYGASAEQRLAIYAGGYLQRLLECLRAEFAALRALVGDQVFDLFARGYLAAFPSRSYSLYDLGAGFPGYLEATLPTAAEPLDRLPCELARLERARVESHRAAGPETDPGGLDAVDLFMTPGARVRIPETVRLLRASFAVADVLEAVGRGGQPDAPEARPVLYAVARSHYRVRVHALPPGPFGFLEACAGGGDVQAAMAAAALASAQPIGSLWADLLAWAPWAIEAGLLARAI
jgi:hypothetical protein